MITLYHGSYTTIENPIAAKGRRNLDFGQGFYLTSLCHQAERWAQLITERKSRHEIPQLNIYQFDDNIAKQMQCKWLHFDSYNLEWLNYVIACRGGDDIWKQYDIVEGGVANDNVIDTVEDYTMGLITAEQALGQLRYKPVNHQMCIINQEIINRCLYFTNVIKLTPLSQAPIDLR
jgi:hypothetical protein